MPQFSQWTCPDPLSTKIFLEWLKKKTHWGGTIHLSGEVNIPVWWRCDRSWNAELGSASLGVHAHYQCTRILTVSQDLHWLDQGCKNQQVFQWIFHSLWTFISSMPNTFFLIYSSHPSWSFSWCAQWLAPLGLPQLKPSGYNLWGFSLWKWDSHCLL